MPTHRPTPVVLLSLLAVLGGCPDLPESTVGDARDAGDTEVFVPLTVNRIYESVGEPPGGERIAIYGAGFTNGSDVGLPVITFGGQQGQNPLVLDDNQINVTVPGRDPGLVDVTVRLPDGQEQTLRDAYLYRGPLAITSISPTVATIDGGIEVTVKGQGFTDDTRILVAGRMLEDAERIDAQTIVGKVPSILAIDAAFDAKVDVIATNGFEQRTLPDAFTFATPLSLTGLEPISGTSLGGTLVTLRGTGLALTTNVYVGGVPAENVSVDAQGSALVVRVPPGPHGAADIRVENVSGSTGSTATLDDAFFHVDESRLPGVLWAGHTVPSRGSPTGGYPVAISVRGLTAATGLSVRWGTVQAPIVETRIEEGAIIVTAPRGEGDVPVVVSRSGVAANTLVFTYAPTFVVDEIIPSSLPLVGGEIAILGAELDGVEVWVGGKPAPTRGTSSRIIARAAAGAPGSVDVVIRKDARERRLSAAIDFQSDETKLWAISPELGAQSGGRVVRMFGEGFAKALPNAKFGDARGSDETEVDDHVYIVRAPLGDPGNVNVGGEPVGRLAMAYRYYDPAQRFGGTMGGPIPEALNITVLDRVTRKGVPDAFVILWDDISGPYQGVTDARGQITFSDVYFGPMQMVTAGADDYTTASIVEFDARDATLNLIPLSPSNPGGGGGGPGPEPLPDSNLSGKVIGFDKYVVTPPGSCDARLDLVTGPLCSPCASDAECGGGENLCTPLGKEGARCTTHCQVHGDCQAGFSCAAVEGGTQCVPSSGRRTARCQVTMPDVFSVIEVPLTPTNADSEYGFDTDPGEYSVVCLGGVEDEITGEFTPLVMGVRRHVFAQSGMEIGDQDVVLDIPLSRTLRIRLDGAPTGNFKTKRHTAQVFVDLGADGVFLMPESGSGLDQNVFELEGFPAAFAESLYDASLTVYATAVADVAPADQTGVGSFVVHDDIKELFSDAVFELGTELGVTHRATGISEPVWGMRELAGTDRLWAVGDEGRVAAFDGGLWGVQQTPTKARLAGVWPAAVDDVWAVGDAGAVLRFDGLRWVAVPMPASIARAAWRGVEGVIDADGTTTLWVWGERGVYRNTNPDSGDVGDWVEVTGPAVGSVNAIRVVSAQEAWLVGHGGLIQRWQNGAVTGLSDYTMPGADLNALTVVRDDLVWAVGDEGRILRWDGAVWFDLLPVTARSLRGIAAPRDDRAWAVGDAGEVLRWDGVRWRVEARVPHSDLFAVGETPSGRVFAAGVATLIIGPFMQLPRPSNPALLGDLRSLNLQWVLEPGADASFNWLLLLHSSGFPFWQIVAADPRRTVPLPDLKAAWGLEAMWPGNNFLQMYRVYIPGFDMAAWDETILTEYRWHSWSVDLFDMIVPEGD